MANVKSVEQTNLALGKNISKTIIKQFNANYTLTGSETDPQVIEMFTLPSRTMITALTCYHENLGAVVLKVGTEAAPTTLIQSELASGIGHGFLGQGLSVGMVPSSSDQLIVVTLDLTSGSYVAGAKIQIWAIGVKV